MLSPNLLRNFSTVRVMVHPGAANLAAGGAQALVNGATRWNSKCQPPNDWVKPMPIVVTSGSADALLEVKGTANFGNPGPNGGTSCASVLLFDNDDNGTIFLHTQAGAESRRPTSFSSPSKTRETSMRHQYQ